MKRRPKNRPDNINDFWRTIEDMDSPSTLEQGARIFADLFPEAKEENERREAPTTRKNNASDERRR